MAIPTFDKLLRPILALADREEITRRSATDAMAREFRLSPNEITQPLPSGRSTVIRNRTGWAMTFLTKGGLIAKIAPKTYRITGLVAVVVGDAFDLIEAGEGIAHVRGVGHRLFAVLGECVGAFR